MRLLFTPTVCLRTSVSWEIDLFCRRILNDPFAKKKSKIYQFDYISKRNTSGCLYNRLFWAHWLYLVGLTWTHSKDFNGKILKSISKAMVKVFYYFNSQVNLNWGVTFSFLVKSDDLKTNDKLLKVSQVLSKLIYRHLDNKRYILHIKTKILL